MKHLLSLLEKYPLAVTLLLAGLVMLFLGSEMVSPAIMPFTDAIHYIERTYSLYGFLHTGQWGAFWDLFRLPRQSITSPQSLLFLLLPKAWAGLEAYAVLHLLCTYGLLGAGLWNLCRALDRREWAPALFLLCACENESFDYPYFFFLDLTFTAFGAFVLSFQIEAWRRGTPRAALLAGLGLGLLYWLKPANALLFSFTFILSELGYAGWRWYRHRGQGEIRAALRRVGWIAAGFAPVFLLALGCGAFQSILLIIQNNELNPEYTTALKAGGLLRLFYFPLCFAYFYNAIVVTVIAGVVVAARLLRRPGDPDAPPEKTPPRPFPAVPLLVIVLSFLVLGEIFSFGMLVKTMRSLVVMLPVLWLFVFWLADRRGIRGHVLFLAAVAFVAVLVDQVVINGYQKHALSPDKYLMGDDWYDYFPLPWTTYDSGPKVAAYLENVVRTELPDGGRVGISTERVFLDGRSLSLLLNSPALLEGRPPAYSCVRLFNPAGRYSPAAFTSSQLMLLFISKNSQYSDFTWRECTNLLAYVPDHWAEPAVIAPILNPRGNILGYAVPLSPLLTPEQLQEGMHWSGAPGPMADDRIDDYIHGRRYSASEAASMMGDWIRKRF